MAAHDIGSASQILSGERFSTALRTASSSAAVSRARRRCGLRQRCSMRPSWRARFSATTRAGGETLTTNTFRTQLYALARVGLAPRAAELTALAAPETGTSAFLS
jgi:hypothetical protein